LNEAFATFMEMLAVDAWRPEWERWTSFGVSRAAAMSVDGLWASRPIEFPVVAPRDCEAMFDLLTYEKGAAVLRMLEQHLGPEPVQAGVRRYLERHAYANAETTDLWKALGDASGQPIPEVMDGWVFRPGYPLVGVTSDGPRLHLSQSRFTYLDVASREPSRPAAGAAAPATPGAAPTAGSTIVAPTADVAETWQVPVTIRASVRGRPVERKTLLGPDGAVLDLGVAPDWVVANAGGHGFYRVGYDRALRDRLTASLSAIQPIERFDLLSDLFALARAGRLAATDFLDLTARFSDETDRNVWSVMTGAFGYLNRAIDDEARPGLAALVRDRLGSVVGRLGWSP